MFKICLVGYTNAGKSTLMNALTDAGVLVEDRLFATLDTRTRKWQLADGPEVLLSDTVGFVRKLPHQLVASFKATLEEAVNADLLLHVVDVSSEDAQEQINSVNSVLAEIGCGEKAAIVLLNKSDAVGKPGHLETLGTVMPDALCISAKTGMGIGKLHDAVLDKYQGGSVLVRVTSPQSNGKVQSFMRANAAVIDEKYFDSSVLIEARIGKNQLAQLCRLSPEKLEVMS